MHDRSDGANLCFEDPAVAFRQMAHRLEQWFDEVLGQATQVCGPAIESSRSRGETAIELMTQ